MFKYRSICKCKNVPMGSYLNQKEFVPPFPSSKRIFIDTCLVNEIMDLWNMGIITTGCCCGHNVTLAFIGVIDPQIEFMKSMGYEVHYNSCRPGDEDSFNSKSIKDRRLIMRDLIKRITFCIFWISLGYLTAYLLGF